MQSDPSIRWIEKYYTEKPYVESAIYRILYHSIGSSVESRREKAGQSLALPQRAMALSPAVSGGRTAGIEQQPGRAQHQALCDRPQERSLCQHPAGRPQVSAVICSLIETAKETGRDPSCYLTWVLETAPTLDRTVESWAVPLLPANAPESCTTTIMLLSRSADSIQHCGSLWGCLI